MPGQKNVVAYCLSRLDYDKDDVTLDHVALNKKDINKYPLSNKIIMGYQQKDKALLKKVKIIRHAFYVPSLLQGAHILY